MAMMQGEVHELILTRNGIRCKVELKRIELLSAECRSAALPIELQPQNCRERGTRTPGILLPKQAP